MKLIVPYPAGGGAADMAARTVAVELAKLWGQPVVVENRPGASGVLGNEFVVKSPADGYTLLLGITTLIQQPFLYAKLPCDTKKDLAPVSQIGAASNLFVVTSDVPAATLKEFAALTRSQSGKFNFGSFGNGSTSHIQSELLRTCSRSYCEAMIRHRAVLRILMYQSTFRFLRSGRHRLMASRYRS